MSMPAGEPCDYEVAPDMTLRGERFGTEPCTMRQ